MSAKISVFRLNIILPLLLTLGSFFALSTFISDIALYVSGLFSKVDYPSGYEFKAYDSLLKRYVKYGLVDYQSLKKSGEIDPVVDELKTVSPDRLKGTLEKLSFWVNAHNLLVIKCINDRYPSVQLRQEPSRRKFLIGGRPFSLNQIKEEMLPPLIKGSDWRAIFLICDGSMSAPCLSDHAYSPSCLSDDFEKAASSFVLNPANYAFDAKQRILSISPFYKWNLAYIDAVYPSPFDMLNSYLPESRRFDLENVYRNYAMPYDWRINDISLLKNLARKLRD